MARKHVVSALVERRARVAGELRKLERHAECLKADLAAIDRCIRMFDPTYDIASIAPRATLGKNPAGLPRGTGSRKAMEVVREAGEALTAREIASRILVGMGREPSDNVVAMLADTIRKRLAKNRNPMIVCDQSKRPRRWWIAKDIAPA